MLQIYILFRLYKSLSNLLILTICRCVLDNIARTMFAGLSVPVQHWRRHHFCWYHTCVFVCNVSYISVSENKPVTNETCNWRGAYWDLMAHMNVTICWFNCMHVVLDVANTSLNASVQTMSSSSLCPKESVQGHLFAVHHVHICICDWHDTDFSQY